MKTSLKYAQETPSKQWRTTLSSSLKMEGIGLHSGKIIRIRMEAAPPGTGIIFRNQRKARGDIPLTPYSVINTLNAVTLGNGKWSVQTIEHLLAALAVTGITDLYIHLEEGQAEIPILDGSSYPWYEALVETGITYSDVELQPICLATAVWAVEGDKYLIALPEERFSIHYSIDQSHPLLAKQSLIIELQEPSQIAEAILPARTFGHLKDVEHMKSLGLIKGGSIENALVLTEEGYMNKDLRYRDECVRHKILDLIGDMYLLGRSLKAHLIAYNAGHTLDVALTHKILKNIEGDELRLYKEEKNYTQTI